MAITAVVGMGGIGKTELALQYVRAYADSNYPGGVCWLEARDQDIASQILAFAAAYLDLHPADELPLAARIAYCWNRWPQPQFSEAESTAPALIVVDDVTDYEAIAPYLPTNERFTLLLTTRQQHLAATVTSVNIEVLEEATALGLLKGLVGKTRIETELEQAKYLCDWLGYLPLALELVGRYLVRKPDLSLEDLQRRLESQDLAARALVKAEPGMTNALGVASAFELSWQALSTEAQKLACLLSCFALAPIPWDRVEACFPEIEVEALEEQRDDELRRLSFLDRVGTYRYQYHQLIQRFIRAKLSKSSPLMATYCQAMVAATQELDDTPTQSQWIAWSELTPHMAEVIHQWDTHLTDDNLVGPYVGLGRFYSGQGLYAQAESWYKLCLSITRDRLGEEHSDVASSLNNLALLYDHQGRYTEAESLYQAALAMRKRLLGNEHPAVALSLNNLALLYYHQGRYAEAEPLFQEALAMGKRLLGEEHPDVASSLNNLAALYHNQGRYAEAEPLYQEALAMRKRLLGEEHPDIASSLNNLALLYHNQGRYAEAEPLFQEALAIGKRLLGEEHPNMARSLNNLAVLYKNQGRYAEAESLYQEALTMYKRVLDNEHPEVARSLNNLAALYDHQGRYAEAEPLYQEALAMRKRVWGYMHPDVALSLLNLGILRFQERRLRAAQPLLLDALLIYQVTLGANHSYTQISQSWVDNVQASLDGAFVSETGA